MRVSTGTYVRHGRYGLGRVVGYEPGLFPRLHLRFEDGEDRALELEPSQTLNRPTRPLPAGPAAEVPGPAPRAGSELGAPNRRDSATQGILRLADGRTLELIDVGAPTEGVAVFTVGYEGRSVERLTETLRRHKVGLLVDIRDAPVSKKPGFSKHELQAAMRRAGIRYELKREWGNPKRKGDVGDARRSPRMGLARYTARLAPHIVDAAAYVEAVLPQRPALLCYEAEPFHCHRSRFTSLVLPHCRSQPRVYHILADDG